MNLEDTGRLFIAKLLHRKAPKEKKQVSRLFLKMLAMSIVNSGRAAKKVSHSGYCIIGAGVKTVSAMNEEMAFYKSLADKDTAELDQE